MSNTYLTPNMNLIIPVPNQDPGPDWGNNLNASFTLLDAHNHSPGSGTQVTPLGLNINSDLTFNINNATNLRSVRFSSNGSPISGAADLGCLYESGVDLYYNDGNGNQVRMTQGGSVTGSSGTITGLPSGTASASFNSLTGTFIFQQATSTPANFDVGPITVRRGSASSPGITLLPNAGIGGDFSYILPLLPASVAVVSTDPSGNMGTWTLGSTLTASGNILRVQAASITNAEIASGTIFGPNIASNTITGSNLVSGTITTTQIASGTILGSNIASTTITGSNLANATITTNQIAGSTITGGNIASGTITATNMAASSIATAAIQPGAVGAAQIAASSILQTNIAPRTAVTTTGSAGQIVVAGNSGAFSTASGTFANVNGCSLTITTTGRPVMVMARGTASNAGNFEVAASNTTQRSISAIIAWQLTPFFGVIQQQSLALQESTNTTSTVGISNQVPAGSVSFIDTNVAGTPGTYTYTLQVKTNSANTLINVNNVEIVAYEI